MVPRVFSTLGDWLLSLLRRYDKNGHLPNVLLCRDRGEPTAGFEEGESPVALVRTGDGRELTLIGERLIERGHTLIRFGEVVRCRWITDQNDALDKAAAETDALRSSDPGTGVRSKGRSRRAGTGGLPVDKVLSADHLGGGPQRTDAAK